MGAQLPLSHDQFLDAFAAYNQALWPAVLALWLVTVAALVLLAAKRLDPRLAGALLALHWAWAGIAYHFAFFVRINPAARLFGALFVLQALLFLWFGVRRRDLAVTWGRTGRQVLSIGFCIYAVLYPFLAAAAGMRWPRMPSFGVPCPTTLLTVGLLLGLELGRLRGLFVVPLLWSLVGGSAAFLLGVRTDLMLLVGAVALVFAMLSRGRSGAPHAA